jgi:Pentapeptide repeats (8 copies)
VTGGWRPAPRRWPAPRSASTGPNLRDADLRGALLRGAQLRDASLRGTRLEGADLELIHDVRPAAEIVESMMTEAAQILRRLGGWPPGGYPPAGGTGRPISATSRSALVDVAMPGRRR